MPNLGSGFLGEMRKKSVLSVSCLHSSACSPSPMRDVKRLPFLVILNPSELPSQIYMPRVRNEPERGDHVQCSLKVDVKRGRIKLRHGRVMDKKSLTLSGNTLRWRDSNSLTQGRLQERNWIENEQAELSIRYEHFFHCSSLRST